MYTTNDFEFDLPEELIAQTPLKDRTASKLLVVDREAGSLTDTTFHHVLDYLASGDTLIVNETKVLPARIHGYRSDTGGKMEFLLLENLEGAQWEVLAKPARRAQIGTEFVFGDGLLTAEVVEIGEQGAREVVFSYQGVFLEVLEEIGEMPLPPYIKETLEDKDRYQTIYAKHEGSAAAPTAGLHFTQALLDELKRRDINIVPVTLHIGLGTFRPVSVDNIADHTMHSEYYQLSQEAVETIQATKARGNKIVAVGTTSVRVVETVAQNFAGELQADEGWTDIFITPGFDFQVVDALITNFHLPASTLLMLVSAFYNRADMLKAYQHAVTHGYRFFSFGDSMMIL